MKRVLLASVSLMAVALAATEASADPMTFSYTGDFQT